MKNNKINPKNKSNLKQNEGSKVKIDLEFLENNPKLVKKIKSDNLQKEETEVEDNTLEQFETDNPNETQIFRLNEPKVFPINSIKHDYKIYLTKKRYVYVYGNDDTKDSYVKILKNGQLMITKIPKWDKLLFWQSAISIVSRCLMLLGSLFLIFAFFISLNINSNFHLQLAKFFADIFKININNTLIKQESIIIYLIFTLLYWIIFVIPLLFIKRKIILRFISFIFITVNFSYLLWALFCYIFYDANSFNLVKIILVIIELIGIISLIASNLVFILKLKKY